METISQKNLPPSLGNSFSHGWNVMKTYFLVLFLVVLVLGIIMAPANMFSWKMDSPDFRGWDGYDWEFFIPNVNLMTLGLLSFLGFLALAYSLLIIPVFRYGAKIMFVHASRDIRPEFNSLIKGFKENYLNIVLANLLAGALIIIGIMILIIPGIIIACRLAFVGFLVSRYATGMSVEQQWRPLRAGGGTMFATAILAFALSIAMACAHFKMMMLLTILDWVVPILLVVLGVEIALNAILDIYRPRIPGQYHRDAFDSRFLGLFNEPGGILHTVASAIDYQFGFQVSQTWFYKLLEKAIVPLLLFLIFTLYILSCVVIVPPGHKQ